MGSFRRSPLTLQAAIATCSAALVITVLAWPLLFTKASFDVDWLMHLWYIWHQSHAIGANGVPSLFVHYSHSVYYPEYAFYGGTLYALAGTLSLVLGDAPLPTYILTYCVDFACAYGGWYWIARTAGLGRWRAHAPGFLFVTSASYLTAIYGRGDWPEFTAISMIALIVAAGLSVLRAERTRLGPAVALAASGVVFCGSHNMTLLWGSTLLAVLAVAIVLCVPEVRKQIRARRVLAVAMLLVPALLVSAWFLLPELAYHSRTLIGSGYRTGHQYWSAALQRFTQPVAAARLWSFSRLVPSSEHGVVFALPLATIAWVLAGAAVLRRAGAHGAWMRVLVILMLLSTLLVLAMTHPALILELPGPYTILQFSYRLENYAVLGLSGAVLAALVLADRATAREVRVWVWTLVVVAVLSAFGAVQQVSAVPDIGNRRMILASYLRAQPPGFSTPLPLEDYNNIELPPLAEDSPQAPHIFFPPTTVHHERIVAVVHRRPGELVISNLDSGPELVRVTGARIVGRTTVGNDILRIEAPAGAAPRNASRIATETITIEPAASAPVTLGRWISAIAAALLALELTALAVAGLRRPRSSPDAAGRPSFPAPAAHTPAGSSQTSSRS